MSTISPHLVVKNAIDAARWYGEVLGAEEISRLELPGGQVLTIGLRIGDTEVHLADEHPDMGIVSPVTLGGTYMALQVEIDDVDATFERALSAGATQFHPLSDTFYGDRAGQFIDPFGHRWGVFKHIRTVAPEEIAAAAAAMFGG
ncbi:VOC family protein [Nocardia sp. NBC_01499]|uniref:VOC family protein n=1 Tax=Nocardia sp. NBC_01499 TaxID=2903597 RepID=UPI003868AD09